MITGIKAPEFWLTLDEMREEGLPQTFDYFRFQKGANNCPFICVHTDSAFLEMLSLDKIEWPEKIPAAATPWKLKKKMPGVYQMIPSQEENPKNLDENGQPTQPLTEKEMFLDHLSKMKNQKPDYRTDERTFRRLVSRKFLEEQPSFSYKGDLDFSVLQIIADSNPEFPRKWNLNDLPGPLKEICAEEHDGRNEVRGVSTSMTYAGKKETYSAMHVEDLDYASANVLLPWSAGKAWVGVHPEDQHILDEYVRTEFRKKCVSPMLHKDLILDLELLDSLGIRWYYFIQKPGDIIITNPAAPHQIVNLGYNLAEATNFYTIRHLVSARRRYACQCPSRLARYDEEAWKRLATFVYSGEFKFLCKTNGVQMPEPGEILTQLLNEADNLSDTMTTSQTWLQENPTIADVLEQFTQKVLGKEPRVENVENEAPCSSVATGRCNIISTAPLDLSFLNQPRNTKIEEEESRSEFPVNFDDTSYPPSVESILPGPCNVDEESIDIFATQETTPPRIKRRRKRTPSPRLFEDPDKKAQRLNARADFFSQRRYDERYSSNEESFFSTPRSPTPRSPTPRSPTPRPSTPRPSTPRSPTPRSPTPRPSTPRSPTPRSPTPRPSTPRPSTPRPSTPRSPTPRPSTPRPSTPRSPRRKDPRKTQADKIRNDIADREKYKETRAASRAKNIAKHGRKPRPCKAASAWFRDYIQRATRKIERAQARIAHYAASTTQPRYCNWNEKLESAEAIKRNLERRRLLHNVLKKMYNFCSDDLQARLDEGYLEKEIFRDFINFHSEENMELLRAALESYNADFGYWNYVLSNEESWNAEFGVDKNYRIPCIEFSKLKFDVLDLL